MTGKLPRLILASLMLGSVCLGTVRSDDSESNVIASPPIAPLAPDIKGVDADGHNVTVNKPGPITLLLGANEESGDIARRAGKAMYPFQGRPDFQLIVVVDLRDSIAGWVPSVVTNQMRSNLDKEAIELKPYFLKNNNKSNPRDSSHVIPDFNGSIFPKLGWQAGTDNLRGILFGSDGREIKRWSKIQNMTELQNDVSLAIEALNAAKLNRKNGGAAHPAPSTSAPSTTPPRAKPVDPNAPL